jgi:hypothetical protein
MNCILVNPYGALFRVYLDAIVIWSDLCNTSVLFETKNTCTDADHNKTIKITVFYVNIKQSHFSYYNVDDRLIAFRN